MPQSDELKLDTDVRQELVEMQNIGMNVNQLLREMLKQRKEGIQDKKQQMAKEQGEKAKPSSPSRYIPKKIKAILQQEYGTKCAHSNCTNISVNIHHQRKFALDASHDPAYLVPFCKQHHEIAHAIDVRVVEKRKKEIKV